MQSDVLTLVAARPGRVRDGLRALLATIPWIKVVDQADDGASALKMVAEHQLVLVLLDTNLPDGRPFDDAHGGVWAVLKQIKVRWPQARCLVLTDNGRQGPAALAAGADEVLVRGFSAAELLIAIERVLSRSEGRGTRGEGQADHRDGHHHAPAAGQPRGGRGNQRAGCGRTMHSAPRTRRWEGPGARHL